MNKLLLSVLAASSAAIVSVPAQAATTIVLSPPGQDASFAQSYLVSGAFNDVYNFTTAASGYVSLAILTFGSSANTNVTFNPTTSKFNGGSFAYTGPSLPFEQLSVFTVPVTYGVLNTFNIAGVSGKEGTYFVNLSFDAVPEPASWAMMIMGIGLVGGALRLRSRRPDYRLKVGYAA